MRTLSPTIARRLAISRQRLAGPRPPADAAGILDVVRDLGCLQLDPISAVARSHLLVLWSRLGKFDPAHLDTLLWRERQLFEYWAHCASIVLTEDYQIHAQRMQTSITGDSAWMQRTRDWVVENDALHQHIIDRLTREGPLGSQHFEDKSADEWHASGWTSGRNVPHLLDFMWGKGTVLVAGRTGQQRLWDLAERVLPSWTPRELLPERELVRRAAQKSLRALGVGRPQDIKNHFIRHNYPGLASALKELEAEGRIERVQIAEDGRLWPGIWYVHTDDLPLLEQLKSGTWQPRTTLLSPFDNLICDRARTELLWDFTFRIEIYVPKAKRQYGYYVLPILHGDKLIGRIDPTFDRKSGTLNIHAVHAEPNAPMMSEAAQAVADAIAELAAFLGARTIVYSERIPDEWRGNLMGRF